MANVLLTGFGKWAGSDLNPAGEVARALDGAEIGGARVRGFVAPSVFALMIDAVTAEIERDAPDIVIMTGEYNGRTMITVERLAQNLIDATRYGFGDEAGDMPQDRPVAEDGPAAYYATVPIRAMTLAMRRSGVPADISDTAATFGCNLLMYGVLHFIARRRMPVRAGWVHLPSLPATAARDENIGLPSMALETQVAGMRAAIEAAVTHAEDCDEPVPSRLQI